MGEGLDGLLNFDCKDLLLLGEVSLSLCGLVEFFNPFVAELSLSL